MKHSTKAFIIFLVVFVIILGGATYWVLDFLMEIKDSDTVVSEPPFMEVPTDEENENNDEVDPYVEMVRNSNRINVLLLGIAEYLLADTMIVLSYDPDQKLVDLISIPRDTFYERTGYDHPHQKKINSTYQVKGNRAQSSMDAVSDVLQIPIHEYVRLDYRAVEKIVDAVGGVDVYIHEDMYYSDPYDDPPLLIDFKKGNVHLNGVDAVKYLRFRDDAQGDLGRIQRQQDFIVRMIKKSFGFNLPKIINITKEYVITSMDIKDILRYSMDIAKIDLANIKTYTVPGKPKYINKVNYYIYDKDTTKEMITQIYSR